MNENRGFKKTKVSTIFWKPKKLFLRVRFEVMKEKVLNSVVLEYRQVGQYEKKSEESLPLITGLFQIV